VSVDIRVQGEGSRPTVYLLRLESDAAREWVEENVGGEVTWWGGSLVVEHGFLNDLLSGACDEGLEVSVDAV
jgi:hypothetical protein